MFTPSSGIAPLALALAGQLAACGGPCHNVISAQREIRDADRGPADGRPHAQLRLPHNRVNVLLASALAREEISATLEIPGPAGLKLPLAKAVATRVELVSAAEGAIGFDTEVSFQLGGREIVSASAVVFARASAVIEDNRASVEIAFDADSVRSVEPQFPDGAVDAIAGMLGPAIEAATGHSVPGPLLGPMAKTLLNHLSKGAFDVVRDQVLARVGEIARFRVDLGRAPVERIEARTADSAQPTLLIDIYSSLPIRVGLREAPLTADPISGTGRLRIAGAALAELANWAIAENLAPQRYDSKLAPDPDGSYVPVYAWRGGDQPLVVHAFRVTRPCSKIVVGAKPEVSVEDGKVKVGIADGSVEGVEGSTLVRLGVGLKDLFGDASIEKSSSGPATASLAIGGRPLQARLLEASLAADELDLTVELSVP